jgi:glycosyltransferase involved in cell wall biosynthesis
MVTAFVPYKRVDLAISAFNQLKWPLKIIGTGPEAKRLKALAGPTIQFLDGGSNHEIREAYAKCRAVLFPGEEDFGIVPLEAMASGKEVIAYGKGGVLETVIPRNGAGSDQGCPTGVFFFEQTVKAMIDAVLYFEGHKDQSNPVEIRASMKKFSKQRFKEEMRQYIHQKYQAFKESHAQTSH